MPETSAGPLTASSDWGVQGRRYLIVGVGSGMGGHCARTLAAAGAKLACCDIVPETAAALAADIGPDAAALVGDITREDDVERLVEQAAERLDGPLDGVVDIVGMSHSKSIFEQSISEFDIEISVNLRQAFMLLRLVGPQLTRNEHGGSMVFISSIVAQSSSGFSGIGYTVAKAGVESLVRSAAIQLAPFNVRVNAVAPGMILNERLAGLWEKKPLEGLAKQTPMGHLGAPSDIASTIYYLLSDMSGHVTGQIINVDGGLSRKFGYDISLV